MVLAFAARADTNSVETEDLTKLSLQQLMQIEVPTVFSASKFEQKATEAPSSVTVITSDEIKRYGWRTLGDLLASAQGFDVTYDRNYEFLGARGVNLGDFNSRILVLVNGHRINNDLNDGAAIGTAFPLDADLIDRVEIVRGPGSVLYGNNAFFGVINVITRQGKQVNGVEASGAYGSFNAASGRVTLGQQFTNGLDVLLSGTLYHSDGPENLFYPAFDTPAQNNGVAHNMDGDGFGSFFGSANYKDLTLEGAFINREKANPTAQYLTTFDDSRLRTVDTRGYATLKYAHQFSDTLDASADVYYDRSDFQIGQPYPNYFEKEQETGAWAGGEAQVNKRLWNRHLLTVGGEFRDDFSQDAHVHVSGQGLAPSDTYYRDRRQNFGVFAQDDLAVLTNLHVNAGVRYDQYYDRQLDFAPAWSPRAAIIYDAFSESTFKLIYGTAFRDPSFYELSELPTLSTKPNPEKITTYEADYEQGIGLHWRSSISAFYNRMDDLIVFAPDGSFTNFNAGSLGAELALEGIWEDGIRTRISYTLQHTENRDTGGGLPDSPAHLIKANVSVPLWEDKIFAGLEFQYASSSHTIMTVQNLNTGNFITQPGPDAPGFAVVNLTLYSHNLVKNLDASVSLYNLLDHRYEEPATRFHLQNVIPQDGLAFRVKLTYHF